MSLHLSIQGVIPISHKPRIPVSISISDENELILIVIEVNQ